MKKKLNFKNLLITIGIGTLVGNNIMIYITWLTAWFNGMKTTVLINSYNEATFEFFFIPISVGIGICSVIYLLTYYIKH